MSQDAIAVIGLTCRFPDAPDVDALWRNLVNGREAVRPLSREEMETYGIDPARFDDPTYVNAAAVLDKAELFDPEYFGYSPLEAELIDPQQRIFLQEARRLLDLANLTTCDLRIGAFAGCRMSTYQYLLPPLRGEEITRSDRFQQLMGNDKDYLVTRAAYKLNFTGPTVVAQSACSSSLVAVHMACESLLCGDCDAALAGGAAISFPQGIGYFRQQGMIFSDDGHCRPFSALGSGIVAANGVGIVALKRLADAKAAGDVIHGVILGSGVSNDGSQRVGYTAPGKVGQQLAIGIALKRSGVKASEIGLLEAHATGTPLGDPLEVQAIAEVYANDGAANESCAIGSLKGNIGHLDSAAGIAGLIKAILSVREGIIPPTLNATPLNESIGFSSTPFYPALEAKSWPPHFPQRIAAVSAFGIGGTNAHVIVAQPPQRQQAFQASHEDFPQVVAFSSHDRSLLASALSQVAQSLEENKLSGQCATLALRREHGTHRIAVSGKSRDDLMAALEKAQGTQTRRPRKTAWMFSGQTGHYPGMGADFYARNAAFRTSADDCFTLFERNGIGNLKDVLFDETDQETINRVLYSQPALFTWQYGVLRMLQDWGLAPDLVLGHSFGEYAAAVCAGYLSLENAVKLVSQRSLLVEHGAAEGAMTALSIEDKKLQDLLCHFPDLHIAAYNGPGRYTLSANPDTMSAFLARLGSEGLEARPLFLNRAFHSPAMESIESAFCAIELAPQEERPTCPMVSCLTTEMVTPGSLNPTYWYRHLRYPSRFSETIEKLEAHRIDRVLEIGPNGGFARLLRSLNKAFEVCAVAQEARMSYGETLAHFYCMGFDRPLQTHYAPFRTSLEVMPPMTFKEVLCWPKAKNPGAVVSQRTEATSPLHGLLAPIDLVSRRGGDNQEIAFVFDSVLGPGQKPTLLQDDRSFAGTGRMILSSERGSLSATYRFCQPSQTGRKIPADGEAIPVDTLVERLERAGQGLGGGWLAPKWEKAEKAFLSEKTAFLVWGKEILGRLDLGDLPTPSDAFDVDVLCWKWRPVPIADLVGCKPSQPSPGQRWLVWGTGKIAVDLADQGRRSGFDVQLSPTGGDGRFDVIFDCRALEDGTTDFESGSKGLAQGIHRAHFWLDYHGTHPESRVLTLLPALPASDDAPSSSPLWGITTLWRTLKNETVPFSSLCLEIDTENPDLETLALLASARTLPTTVLRLKDGGCYEALVEPAPLCRDPRPLDWDNGKTTLIAGFGPVGRKLALWLSGQGCKDICLVLHRETDAAQKETITALEKNGVTVRPLPVDVRDTQGLQNALRRLDVPVGRVFHCAHGGTSALVGHQPLDDILQTLSVKVEGSLALYQALRDQPLELFCLFSSATSMLAMPGAAYNVANAWQDAFAVHLHMQGIPALSIAWGQLEMDRRTEKQAQLQTTALKPISETVAFEILNDLLRDRLGARIPICMDKKALATTASGLPMTQRVLSRVLAEEISAEESGQLEKDVSLEGFDETSRISKIAAYLRRIVNERLRFEEDALDADRPLTQQGVDSLVFLELIAVINKQFDLSLPTATVHKHRTINALAGHINGLIALHRDIDFSKPLGKGDLDIISRPEDRFVPFGLTDLQQAYLVGRDSAMALGSVSCHQYMEFDLPELPLKTLENAWNRLIARHDMMRAVMLPTAEQQILENVPPYVIEVEDVRDTSAKERNRSLLETRARMSYQVFDPLTWPLFELRASRLPEGMLRLHLDMDLLIFDVQSFRVLFRELAGLLENPDLQLPELTLSYRDYVLAEERLKSLPGWKAAKDYWHGKLETFPDAPRLPLRCDPHHLTRPTFRTLTHRLGEEKWRRFKTRAKDLGLTPSGALLSAFSQALAHYTRDPDFALNITYFNRRAAHPQVQDICGDFTSVMLLPVFAHRGKTFTDSSKQVQKDLWDALSHREYSGIRVIRDLGRHRGRGAQNVEMPVVFTSMIGMDFDDRSMPEWTLMSKQVYQINQTPQVWLDYQATEFGGALNTNWFIADDLFDPALIQDLFETYTDLLERLALDDALWSADLADLVGQGKTAFDEPPEIRKEAPGAGSPAIASQSPDREARISGLSPARLDDICTSLLKHFEGERGLGLMTLTAGKSPLGFVLRHLAAAGEGSLVSTDPRRPFDALHWRELILDKKPSLLCLSPGFANLLLDVLEDHAPPGDGPAHVVIEARHVQTSLIERLRTLWPACKLHKGNVWGGSSAVLTLAEIPHHGGETSVDCLGQALGSVEACVLDTLGRERPDGVPGEICFVHKTQPGAPTLRSGYLGKRLTSGEIILIEPASVQNRDALRLERFFEKDPSVSQIVIRTDQTRTGETRHHAWYIPVPNVAPQNDTLGSCQALAKDLNPARESFLKASGTFDLDAHRSRYGDMERLSTLVILKTLRLAGTFTVPGQGATFAEIFERLCVSPKFEGLLQCWLNVLVEDGYLHTTGEGSYVAKSLPEDPDEEETVFNRLSQTAKDGEESDRKTWGFFLRCIENLRGLLSGTVNPLELMFDKGETDFAESWYRDNALAKLFNAAAAETVRCLLGKRTAGTPMRILEIGAGTGSLTHGIVESLPSESFDYLFTDLSPFFLDDAQKAFAHIPAMGFARLDIDTDPALQGFDRASFDLIVGSNVMHDARNLRKSARMLRSLLKPEGEIVLLEGTDNPRFALISLSFLEGLRHFEDERVETLLPLVKAPSWEQVLRDAGFGATSVLPQTPSTHDDLKYHVIVARNAPARNVGAKTLADKTAVEDILPSGHTLVFHRLEAMPLTRDGEIDHDQLVGTPLASPEMEQDNEDTPPGETQIRLALIWENILNVRVTEQTANFFVLGGDSLLMTRLAAKVREDFGVDPGLAALLKTPILRRQAELLEARLNAPAVVARQTPAFETGTL